jgi:hypothetical protein
MDALSNIAGAPILPTAHGGCTWDPSVDSGKIDTMYYGFSMHKEGR